MLRKLVDYQKLDHQLAALLIETYPNGYGDDDIIIFKNLKGEIVEAVEIRTSDTIYLVKISKSLSNFIANFEENMEKELEDKESPILDESKHQDFELENSSENDPEELD
ncbi:hypothetical protein Q4603_10335 [Zobellia galactanivorans]|uniref:Uncharacterized protein n=1 Tax=Zobellia galactanivorans (strain DSM 12802 / CCUG 47099 / CIP 106680 / NCIMB 13871 / Dsij) TaxID=63186 RepID=G0L6V5_ZOBGA|nr:MULTISPECIES: hypothetical protein [Zobellia]MBU3025751.1 hypothetical protein [Zobellia galactanivorans]MDO6809013.1 hypothetical protein [Zobellia galactanivorans]OWW25983.1 hypothetical protein B4Q04_10410 [Zobellia sp. OII3]CAZ98672.1 Conserved hypothetical protein [Zobellia galactanivorans]